MPSFVPENTQRECPSAVNNAVPAAPYERTPAAPFIHIPYLTTQAFKERRTACLELPSFQHLSDSTHLTSEDLKVITGNMQIARDNSLKWTYEQRRSAQPILDFLYLGPTSVVRDEEFLQNAGITMILVVRDIRMASRRMLSADRAADALGIRVEYIDLHNDYQLIHQFPSMIRLVNDHMLHVYRSQAQGTNQTGELLVEAASFRRGNVLVVCESGNERSATLVTAYIMAMFHRNMVDAINFVNMQRFCASLEEEHKRMLQSWEDLINAESSVAIARQEQQQQQQSATAVEMTLRPAPSARPKRSIDDLMDTDENDNEAASDQARFSGRSPFAPFVDGGQAPQ